MLILEVVYLSRKNRHLLFFNFIILHIDDYLVTFAPCLTNLIISMAKVDYTDLPSFSGCVDDCEMCPLFLNLTNCGYESSFRNFR